MKGRYPRYQLVGICLPIGLALDNKSTTSVIYIDFSRAFDMVVAP